MYSPRATSPIQHRLRRSKRSDSSRSTSVSGCSSSSNSKRKADDVCSTRFYPVSPKLNGDYQVLQQGIETQREAVREARSGLALCLDRLGEHHVRQKEYDNAMDAFAEALHEKRSIFSNVLSGSWFGQCGGGASAYQGSNPEACDGESVVDSELHDQAIDEIVTTLRNMGNVHSLRGEQDEAMRYYTEVTNLRATKSSNRTDGGDDSTALFSGIGAEEDNSTMMSEINEDVKALDDMFRSISFRSRDSSSSMWQTTIRKPSTPLSIGSVNKSNPCSKRRRWESDILSQSSFAGHESELFRRSVSMGFPTGGNELSEALEMFKSVLETYDGPLLDQHKETFNSLALRVDLLAENLKKPISPSSSAASSAPDLELALEVYQHTLSVQREIQVSYAGQRSAQVSGNIASTLIRMGSLFYKLGDRTEELLMYNEAKDVYSIAFGENHSFVAGTRKNIGMVRAELGEYGEAMAEFEKARQIYLAVNKGSEKCRDVASAISCMGNVKNRVGELDAALKLYMDAVEIYKALLVDAEGTDRVTVATKDVTGTLKVIGMVHSKKGDLDKAMTFFAEALEILKSSSLDSAPSGLETTAAIYTRMAFIFVKKGELDDAMNHYREAYDLTVRHRGTTNHQEVAGILHYIGGVYHKRTEYDEAMNCYQEAIRIYHSTLGPGNPTVAGTLVMVGSIHYKRRNLDSAMMFYREALRLNRDTYGLHHPDVAPILKSIGTILTKKGEYQEAYEVFRDVLSIKCTVYGTNHTEVASAYKSLGNVHYKLGELADAERQYRHALSIYRHTRGEDHPDTVAARTTIDHIRYWMKERGQRKDQEHASRDDRELDERSC
jgi:tetratricopeptide (TPR) repeat protein